MSQHLRNRLYETPWQSGFSFLDASFKGHPFGKHTHNAFAIGVMTAGVGGYSSKGASFVFPSHTLSLMNPEQSHDGYALQGRLEYKMLYITEQALGRLLPRRPRKGFDTTDPRDDDQRVERAFTSLAKRLEHPAHHGWELAFDGELIDTLDWLFVRYGRERPVRAGQEPEAVRRVREYLDAMSVLDADDRMTGLDRVVTLESLGAMVNLHPHYLLNAFRRVMGVPPYQYFVQRRVERGRELLRRGYTSTEVAFRLGFYDQAHWIRSFKRILGVTPRRVIFQR
ncbi:AraC family transcriptional regulator [Salinisphaera sp. LB1]|uniref:helix-turn-helix domain-containing protein n=1 Tax=Salinisphaera sp. LB1 TaxID=2183911 RepID=UPI000D70739F|nr:AraC family transcriptional regulator [Salinisphaera sp. LB1]